MELSRDNDQKKRIKATVFCSKNVYIFSIVGNSSFLEATIVLSHSPKVYNATAPLDKLTCTNYKDFVKCQDRVGRFSWSKNDSNHLVVKLKLFKRDENKDFLKSRNGRGRFQPVHAIDESAGHCSRKLW